jgi:NADH dehydrogenase FAD-containing subunit
MQNGLLEQGDEIVAKPFKYVHLGSLAYIGNAAVFDLGKWNFMGGLVGSRVPVQHSIADPSVIVGYVRMEISLFQ